MNKKVGVEFWKKCCKLKGNKLNDNLGYLKELSKYSNLKPVISPDINL
jgi:hypothetical protein